MGYNIKKKQDNMREYEGESLYKEIPKDTGEAWFANEGGYWELYSADGQIATAPLTKSVDDSNLIVFIPKSATIGLVGNYKVYVHLTDSNDVEVDDVIREYKVQYISKTEMNTFI